jgi:hypothetical protein
MELEPQVLGYEAERRIFRRPDLIPAVVLERAATLVHRVRWQRDVEEDGSRALVVPILHGLWPSLHVGLLLNEAELVAGARRMPGLLAAGGWAVIEAVEDGHPFPGPPLPLHMLGSPSSSLRRGRRGRGRRRLTVLLEGDGRIDGHGGPTARRVAAVCRRAAPGIQHGAFSLGRNARDALRRGASVCHVAMPESSSRIEDVFM